MINMLKIDVPGKNAASTAQNEGSTNGKTAPQIKINTATIRISKRFIFYIISLFFAGCHALSALA